MVDRVNQSEYTKVLIDGEITGKRSIDSRKVRTLQRLRALLCHIDTLDANRTAGRFENTKNHVDCGRLPSAVRPKQADDLVPGYLERNAVHGHCSTVFFREG